MSIQFKDEKSLNVSGMKMIPIKTTDDEEVFVKTNKCFSFGVRKDKKFETVSMSLVLDEESLKTLKNIVKQCEDHLGHPLTKKLFYGKYGNMIYPKLKRYVKFLRFRFLRNRRLQIRRKNLRSKSRFGSRWYFVERRPCKFASQSLRGVGQRPRPRARQVDRHDLVKKIEKI